MASNVVMLFCAKWFASYGLVVLLLAVGVKALASTTMRSTFSATSSMLWLTITTVVPFSRW